LWYRDFTPTSDDEVRELLGRAARFAARLSGGAVRGRRGV
jgi:predicted phosphoribosyltransferase